jgi:hypothetical protein
LQALRERLHAKPEAEYDEFERALKQLRDARGICVCPVLMVDEFERLLDDRAQDVFPYPTFFNALRHLITEDLVAMVIASRRPLAHYFTHPLRPRSLTSTFPSYFPPCQLSRLDDEAADALLLQESPHRLTVVEAAMAKRWARGRPCHLQAAGQAWYEAHANGQTAQWAMQRFAELKSQSCMTEQAELDTSDRRRWWLGRAVRAVVWDAPRAIGLLARGLGTRLDDMAAWLIGMAIILLLALIALGMATGNVLVATIKKGLGLE